MDCCCLRLVGFGDGCLSTIGMITYTLGFVIINWLMRERCGFSDGNCVTIILDLVVMIVSYSRNLRLSGIMGDHSLDFLPTGIAEVF